MSFLVFLMLFANIFNWDRIHHFRIALKRGICRRNWRSSIVSYRSWMKTCVLTSIDIRLRCLLCIKLWHRSDMFFEISYVFMTPQWHVCGVRRLASFYVQIQRFTSELRSNLKRQMVDPGEGQRWKMLPLVEVRGAGGQVVVGKVIKIMLFNLVNWVW